MSDSDTRNFVESKVAQVSLTYVDDTPITRTEFDAYVKMQRARQILRRRHLIAELNALDDELGFERCVQTSRQRKRQTHSLVDLHEG